MRWLLIVCLLAGCVQTRESISCAEFPVAGEKVADELKNTPYNGYEDFWEWVGRLNKLRQELELCK